MRALSAPRSALSGWSRTIKQAPFIEIDQLYRRPCAQVSHPCRLGSKERFFSRARLLFCNGQFQLLLKDERAVARA